MGEILASILRFAFGFLKLLAKIAGIPIRNILRFVKRKNGLKTEKYIGLDVNQIAGSLFSQILLFSVIGFLVVAIDRNSRTFFFDDGESIFATFPLINYPDSHQGLGIILVAYFAIALICAVATLIPARKESKIRKINHITLSPSKAHEGAVLSDSSFIKYISEELKSSNFTGKHEAFVKTHEMQMGDKAEKQFKKMLSKNKTPFKREVGVGDENLGGFVDFQTTDTIYEIKATKKTEYKELINNKGKYQIACYKISSQKPVNLVIYNFSNNNLKQSQTINDFEVDQKTGDLIVDKRKKLLTGKQNEIAKIK